MVKTTFCPKCKAKFGDKAQYCPICGPEKEPSGLDKKPKSSPDNKKENDG